jgi:16S rRNA (adenine1518-N6/adenine1519-N6)-dimethyltransferase
VSRQRLGQHFLVKGSILDRIAAAACPRPEPLVVEIGPGKGALTERLLARAGRVVGIEIDPYLAGRLREKFPDRLEVIEADVLDTDLNQWGPAVVAGNLPYYISTAILSRVLSPGSLLARGVLLVQKEVAERITAGPGSRAYGGLSVEAQLYADVRVLFAVRPSAFHPPPKVESAMAYRYPARGAGLNRRRIPERPPLLCRRERLIRNNWLTRLRLGIGEASSAPSSYRRQMAAMYQILRSQSTWQLKPRESGLDPTGCRHLLRRRTSSAFTVSLWQDPREPVAVGHN